MKPAIILLLFTVSVSARMFSTYPDTGNGIKPMKFPINPKEPSNAELTDVIGSRETYEKTSFIESWKQMEFLLKDITTDPPSTIKRKPSFHDTINSRCVKNRRRLAQFRSSGRIDIVSIIRDCEESPSWVNKRQL